MSIGTYSAFNYGHDITDQNLSLDFDEGSGELNAKLNVGDYSLAEFATEVARAMTEAGTQTYSASVDRSTRKITISATSNFDLLVSSGTNVGTGVWSLLGFTGSDQTGTNSYEGDSASGSQWLPQFLLQEYVPFDDFEEAVDASVNVSASGVTENVSFGTVMFMECQITNITDETQPSGSPIKTDNNARANARDFLQYARTKAKLEFLEDRDTPGTFTKCILESTGENRDGVGFKLEKMYSEGVIGHFQTGDLTFRKVD